MILSGPYKIPSIAVEVYGVLTNTVTVDTYRGAGRPEATYIIERLMDLLARQLKMDPAEVRMKNFIPPNEFPYTAATGLIYDSGNYLPAMEKAMEMVGYDAFRKEQEKLRAEGKARR